MEFRILGPLEVCAEGGRKLDLTGKQRALLAILLLHANEAVSTDRLIDELWGTEPPETAGKALQVYVSRLRKLLAPEADGILATRPPGYALELGPHELDLHSFERLRAEAREALADGNANVAAERLREALSLWRGTPLADFVFEPFARSEIDRLDELRLTTLEDRIGADLALGRHSDVIGELEALVAENPLRERLRAQLMLALYRARRQVEALDVYQATRRALVDELGIEPSPELQQLERRILRQDPSLELEAPALPAEPTPEQVPAARRRAAGTFVAREWELATLQAGLEDALAGRGRLFLLVGEAGIGKSRLADEFAARAKERRALVLWGRCWEAGGAPAYWPWVQSLRSYVRSREPEALRAELGAGAHDLAQLLPELHEVYPDLPAPPSVDPESARFRFFESVAAFLRNAARKQPLVLVLDDLHAADESSLLLLRFLAGELAELSVVVVGTYREEEAVEDEPVSASLSELRRLPSRHLRLGGLSLPDVASFIELSTGIAPPPALVGAVHTETEGNPLFVGEVVRLLASEGRLSETPDVGWRLQIPPGLHEVIARRLRRLSKDCRRLLTLASVLGREFSLEALERAAGLPEEELLEVLDEAFGARVLAEVPGAVGRMRFSHARVRDALYDDISIARRAQLHRRIGEALEELYGSDPEPYLAELAHHYFLAGPRGDIDKAIEYTRRAGDRAVALLAFEEAVRQYQMSLRALERRPARDAETCELLLRLGDAQARAGDTPASHQSLHAAADLAEGLGLPEHLARAALGYGGRMIWEVSRGDVDHVALLERALAALGQEDSTTRVKLLARLAGGPLRDTSFPPEGRRSLSEEALEMARRIGDPGTLAYALSGYNTAHHSPQHTRKQATLATELIQVAMEAGDPERAVEGHEHRATALIELGDLEGAKADVAAMARLAEELRQPPQDWFVVVYRAHLALLEGELTEAEGLIADARVVGERAQSWSAAVSYGLQLFVLRREQGRLEEVEDLVRRSVAEYPTYPIWRCVQTQMVAELGYTAEARDALQALAADGFAALPFDEEWLVSLGLLAETARILGDAERAAVLHPMLLPYGDRVAVSYPEISTGSVARYLGLLAATSERWDDAERHFEDALAMNVRIGARPWLAHTQEDYARMLLEREGPGDAERAEELLEAALATYRELGMESYAASASTAG
jgi:DNA-binding SARP family transcriptional activator